MKWGITLLFCALPTVAFAQPAQPAPPDQGAPMPPPDPNQPPPPPDPNQPPPPPPQQQYIQPQPVPVPGTEVFVPGEAGGAMLPTLLSTSPGLTFDATLSYEWLKFLGDEYLDLAAVDLHAQYIAPNADGGGVGGYLRVPIGIVAEEDIGDDGRFYLGNIELGGLLAAKQGPATVAMFRLGVTLGEFRDDESAEDALIAGLANVVPNVQNYVTTAVPATSFRLGGQIKHNVNKLVLGGSANIDLPYKFDTEAGQDSFDGGFLNINVAAGIEERNYAITGAFSYMQAIFNDDEGGNDSLSTLTIRADTAASPTTRLFGAFTTSVNSDLDGYAFTFGVRILGQK